MNDRSSVSHDYSSRCAKRLFLCVTMLPPPEKNNANTFNLDPPDRLHGH